VLVYGQISELRSFVSVVDAEVHKLVPASLATLRRPARTGIGAVWIVVTDARGVAPLPSVVAECQGPSNVTSQEISQLADSLDV
jgi:hypothetical protein